MASTSTCFTFRQKVFNLDTFVYLLMILTKLCSVSKPWLPDFRQAQANLAAQPSMLFTKHQDHLPYVLVPSSSQ